MRQVVVLDHRDRQVAERIRHLQRASYGVEALLIGYDRMPPLVERTDDIMELVLTILGVVEQRELQGLVGYRRHRDLVDVDRLAVHPSKFRRGIGARLLESVHEREQDARRFEVSTGANNEPAIALYRAAGYTPMGEEDRDGVAVVQLVRELR